MLNYKIKQTNRAISDLEDIVDFLCEQDFGFSTYEKIEKRINSLQNFPERYPRFLEIDEQDIRITYVNSYAIFYTVDRKNFVVEVVRILSARLGTDKMRKIL